MKRATLKFDLAAKKVYFGCMHALNDCGIFRNVEGDERTFRIHASRGLPLLGESVDIAVVSTSTDSCDVEIKSSDKLFLNPFNFGHNRRNVNDLSAFIRNEVYRYHESSISGPDYGKIKINNTPIRLKQPEILINKN